MLRSFEYVLNVCFENWKTTPEVRSVWRESIYPNHFQVLLTTTLLTVNAFMSARFLMLSFSMLHALKSNRAIPFLPQIGLLCWVYDELPFLCKVLPLNVNQSWQSTQSLFFIRSLAFVSHIIFALSLFFFTAFQDNVTTFANAIFNLFRQCVPLTRIISQGRPSRNGHIWRHWDSVCDGQTCE